jgi:3-oxoadipate enol-lactonase
VTLSVAGSVDARLFELARALSSLQALLSAVGSPRCATGGTVDPEPATVRSLQEVIDRVARGLGLPRLLLAATPEGLSAAELAISNHLALGRLLDSADRLSALSYHAVDEAVASARAGAPQCSVLLSHDGAPLHCYSAGRPSPSAVVLVSACGMPVGLVEGWMRQLSEGFRVVTWESRGLFGADPGFDARDHSLAAQAADVVTVLDGFGIVRAHLMGLCGGAPIALAAAGIARVSSLSLWHGDYELGGEAPKTQHQQAVEVMLTMSGRSRADARSMHAIFQRRETLAKLRADIAHHLLYPYANGELLYRYARLNGAIMTTDCRPLLAATQPTLVVTSLEDATAHPQGSLFVASRLPQGRLEVMPGGDHLAAFDASPNRVELARAFIAETFACGGAET